MSESERARQRPADEPAARGPHLPRWARWMSRSVLWLVGLIATGAITVVVLVAIALSVAYPNLPEIGGLMDYRPKLPMRVFSADGVLLGEYGEERRNFVPLGQIPKVMQQAVEAARMAWGLCTVAGVAGKGETLDVIPRWLITGRRVAGSSFGGVKGRDGVPKLVDLWMEGKIDVDPFISHRITLDEVNRGFELMEAQDGIRSVIVFD